MKKLLALTLSFLLLMIMLAGCGMASMANDEVGEIAYTGAPYDAKEEPDEAYGYPAESPTDTLGTVAENRKLIRRVSLSLETEEYDVLLTEISGRLAACGGYMEQLSADTRYTSNSRYATMTVRVPADRLDTFVSAVSDVSNVVQRSEETDDVTLA